MQFVLDAIDSCGGIASTSQLRARGISRWILDITVMHGRVIRVRKGRWANPTVPPAAMDAHRVGGRLACVSALVHHGVIEDSGFDLHVALPANASRLRKARLGTRAVVRHWSRREVAGDRLAVSVEVAWAQFALCRGVAGRDVRLRRTDSL
jgi:hypothetical protein